MENYQTKSPVLFLIFSRPDTTLAVFEQIRLVKPARLYIAADGARKGNPGEEQLCRETLSVVNNITWPCQVKTLYRNDNLGCKDAVSSAIDWFFDQEEEGIILEDDCLPTIDFFSYCDELLEKYRFDTRVRHIAGSNLQLGRQWGEASYYFAQQTHVWGWASWRRVWKDYDKTLSAYKNEEALLQLDKIFDDQFVANDWKNIFKDLKEGLIDTWDYQLALINYFNNGLSINPNANLISNIGFRADGTHTTGQNNPYANIPLGKLGKLMHPQYMLAEKQADHVVFNQVFNLQERWRQHNLLRRQFKRWLRSKINKA